MSRLTKKASLLRAVLYQLAVGLIFQLMLPVFVVAQEGDDYEEVMVTAQLREQNLQEVPLSISAFSSDFLDNTSTFGVGEIAKFTPGFTASSFTSAEPIFAIRGANNTFTAAAANKPVAVFLDDVFISRNSGAAFDLFDLEQVTVLRGPQGTLAGRNVTGGVINVRTAKPSLDEFTGKIEAGYGDYDFLESRGLINGPIGQNIAAKASYSIKQRDGFGRDRLSGQELNDLDSLNLRGQMLFQPINDLEILLSMSYGSDANNNRILSNEDPRLPRGTTTTYDDGDIRTAEINPSEPQLFERDVYSAAIHLDWDINPYLLGAGTFKSITAYSKADVRNVFARVGANGRALTVNSLFTDFDDNNDDKEKPRTFSQEFRFVSDDTDRYNYVVGLYYFHEQNDRYLNITRRGTTGVEELNNTFDQDVETHSIAVYTDIQLHITDYMDINFGGRYTYDNKDAREQFDNNGFDRSGPPFYAANDRSWNHFTPRAVMSFYPTDDMTVFVNYSEGFTSGGFFTEAVTANGFNTPFDEETVRNIELGIKAQWLDRTLTTNLTAFREKYKDKQEIFFTGRTPPAGLPRFTVVTANAGEATIQGVEAEFGWTPIDNLNISATYAYLSTNYDEFIAGSTRQGAVIDYSGNDLASSPEHSASLYADYTHRLANSGSLLLNGSVTWTDNYYNGAANKAIESVEAATLLNTSLSYLTADERARFTVWVKNLTDEDVKLFGSTFNTAAAAYGPPRTFGARFTYQF